MRAIIAVFLATLLSCQPTPKLDMTPRQINLINDLGQIDLLVPASMDSFNSWVNVSDNICDDQQEFRYSNSEYDILLETARNRFAVPDSLYQFTVVQPLKAKCSEGHKTTIDNDFLENWKKRELVNNYQTQIFSASVEQIDGRQFALLAESTPTNDKNSVSLRAYTVLDGQLIGFGYTCYAANCDDFIDDMKESLKTIKITTPNNR